MRLRAWQRSDTAWRDANDWFAHRHGGVVRDLVLPLGDDQVTFRLAIDISDIELHVFRPSPGWPARFRSWELATAPTEADALAPMVAEAIGASGCGVQDIERTARLLHGELVRLVGHWRKERDQRLSKLPPPAGVRWNDIEFVDEGQSAERHGVYDHNDRTLELRLSTLVAMLIGGYPAGFSIVSRRHGGARQQEAGLMPLDGICQEGIVQMLESGVGQRTSPAEWAVPPPCKLEPTGLRCGRNARRQE